MAQTQPPPPLPKTQPSFTRRHSTMIKLLGVGALVLVLLIPLVMITGVLTDRLQRRNEAVSDITSPRRRERNVSGRVRGIPFISPFRTSKDFPLEGETVERREVEESAASREFFPTASL